MANSVIDRYDPEENKGVVVAIVVSALIFHLILFLGAFVFMKLVPKPKKFERPKTIKVVMAPRKKTTKPKTQPKIEKPTPKVEVSKPVEKPTPKKPKVEPKKPKKPKVEPKKPKKPKVEPKKPKKPKNTTTKKTTKKAPEVEEDISALSDIFNDKPNPMDVFKQYAATAVKRKFSAGTTMKKYPYVTIYIRRDGTITNAKLAKSCGNAAVDKRAVAAAKNVKKLSRKVPSAFKGNIYKLTIQMEPEN